MTPPAPDLRLTIMQGEARASADPRVTMTTILGSCVATCLFDPVARVGGMNHFLLAEPPDPARVREFDSDYGLFLMELLINEMLKLGAVKSRMKARLYGGANMNRDLAPIGSGNAAFARAFLAAEGIAKVYEDLEGTHARRVEFRPSSGMVRARIVEADGPPPAALTQKPRGAAQSGFGAVELF
ncbi:MAG: chemotaxis protein CheD [Erythrobacter sp.]